MGCIKEADSSDYLATEAIVAEEAQCNQDANGDPVNMVTGAFTFAEHDLSIPTKRLILDLTRHYNNQLYDSDSQVKVSGFGRGWTHSLSLHLEPGPGPAQISYIDDLGTRIVFSIILNEYEVSKGKITLHGKDDNFAIVRSGKLVETFDVQGNHQKINSDTSNAKEKFTESEFKSGPDFFQVTYKESENNITIFELPHTKCRLIPPAGALALELNLQPNGEFSLRQIDGLTARFNATGRLIQLARPGPGLDSHIDLAYDSLGRLIDVSDSNGRGIKFHYQGESHLINKVSDHAGRYWEYLYNEHQELVEVCDPANRVRRYSYLEWSGTVATGKGKTASSKIRAINKIFPFAEKGKPATSRPELINQYTSDRRVARQKNALGQVTRFDYNRFTYTTYLTDPAGWTTVYAFDANGNTTKVRKPCGGMKEFIYDNRDNLLAEIDESGNTTQYVDLKDIHRLEKEREFGQRANGNRSAYVTLSEDEIAVGYDAFGNRPLVRDTLGNVTRFFEYNHFGRPKRVELPDGSSVLFKFDLRSGLPIRTEKTIKIGRLEALTQIQEWQYDDFGNPTRYEEYAINSNNPIDPKRVVAIEYDSDGNHPIVRREWIESQGEGEKFSTDEKYTWDALGRLVSKTVFRRNAPDGNFEVFSSQFGYDVLGHEIWQIDPNNIATCSLRDLKGQIIETFLVAEASSKELPNVPVDRQLERKRWQYDDLGQETAFIDPSEAKTLREWDSCGRCIKITDPIGFTTTFEYDRDGNQISKLLKTGYRVKTNYDNMGRPVSYLDNLGRYTERTYDPMGRIRDVSEGKGDQCSKTQFEYDVLGHLTCIMRSDGTIERFNFDEANNLVYHYQGTIDKPENQVEKYAYDALGRRTAIRAGSDSQSHSLFTIEYIDKQRAVNIIDAIGNHFLTYYDSLGNVIRKIDGEDRTLKLEYDGLNRLVQRSSDDGTVASKYLYDAVGRLEEAQEALIRYNWYYDRGGRLARHDQAIGNHNATITYEYDESGRLNKKHMDDAWWMRFEYLPNTPFVSLIEIPGKTLNIQMDLAGRVIEEAWNNEGGLVRYQFHPNGNLIGKVNYDEHKQRVFEQRIERDSRGRPTTEVCNERHREKKFRYAYDQFNQLVRIDQIDDGSIKSYRRFVYDELGNKLEEYREGKLFAVCSYDPANHLMDRSDGTGKVVHYSYDRNGNMIQRGDDTFTYDPSQRLQQVILQGGKGGRLQYQYTATDVLGVCLGPQKEDTELIFYDGLQQIIANTQQDNQRYFWNLQVDALLARSDASQIPHRAYTNTLGSILSLDPANEWHEYGPWGEIEESSVAPYKFGFSGKRYESNIGLYYSRARYYDPTIGRFTQPDPTGESDGVNVYLYAKNNPLVYADPLGLASCKVDSVKDSHGALSNTTAWSPTYQDLTTAGLKDAHHIIMDAAVRNITGYSRMDAPAIPLPGPSTESGTPHYAATRAQAKGPHGTYGAERETAKMALYAAGLSNSEVNYQIARADAYFMGKLGLAMDSPTRIPGTRD